MITINMIYFTIDLWIPYWNPYTVILTGKVAHPQGVPFCLALSVNFNKTASPKIVENLKNVSLLERSTDVKRSTDVERSTDVVVYTKDVVYTEEVQILAKRK